MAGWEAGGSEAAAGPSGSSVVLPDPHWLGTKAGGSGGPTRWRELQVTGSSRRCQCGREGRTRTRVAAGGRAGRRVGAGSGLTGSCGGPGRWHAAPGRPVSPRARAPQWRLVTGARGTQLAALQGRRPAGEPGAGGASVPELPRDTGRCAPGGGETAIVRGRGHFAGPAAGA